MCVVVVVVVFRRLFFFALCRFAQSPDPEKILACIPELVNRALERDIFLLESDYEGLIPARATAGTQRQSPFAPTTGANPDDAGFNCETETRGGSKTSRSKQEGREEEEGGGTQSEKEADRQVLPRALP